MRGLLDKINLLFEQVPDKMQRHRFMVLGIFIILTVVAVAGARRIRVDMSMESFFKEGEPAKHRNYASMKKRNKQAIVCHLLGVSY